MRGTRIGDRMGTGIWEKEDRMTRKGDRMEGAARGDCPPTPRMRPRGTAPL